MSCCLTGLSGLFVDTTGQKTEKETPAGRKQNRLNSGNIPVDPENKGRDQADIDALRSIPSEF
ncbi:MAG: hypothetical protein MI743_12635 [Sneathiellales bacterium]|nr:hypothetical protein [Sneathiellales bacterium]